MYIYKFFKFNIPSKLCIKYLKKLSKTIFLEFQTDPGSYAVFITIWIFFLENTLNRITVVCSIGKY